MHTTPHNNSLTKSAFLLLSFMLILSTGLGCVDQKTSIISLVTESGQVQDITIIKYGFEQFTINWNAPDLTNVKAKNGTALTASQVYYRVYYLLQSEVTVDANTDELKIAEILNKAPLKTPSQQINIPKGYTSNSITVFAPAGTYYVLIESYNSTDPTKISTPRTISSITVTASFASAPGQVQNITTNTSVAGQLTISWDAPDLTNLKTSNNTALTANLVYYRIYYLLQSEVSNNANNNELKITEVLEKTPLKTPSQIIEITNTKATGNTKTILVSVGGAYYVLIQAYNATLPSKITTSTTLNSLTVMAPSGNVQPSTLQSIITAGRIPVLQDNDNEFIKDIFSVYTTGATVVARYIVPNGAGTKNATSWANAGENVKTVIDSITDASATKIYVLLIASGTYDAGVTMKMKNYIAIIGGFTTNTFTRSDANPTILSGGDTHRVFFQTDDFGGILSCTGDCTNPLDNSGLLYGVTVSNGRGANDRGGSGGGIFFENLAPRIINVIIKDNVSAGSGSGGGMLLSVHGGAGQKAIFKNVSFINNSSASTGGALTHNGPVSFSNLLFKDNKATTFGGAIYLDVSDLEMNNVTFINNSSAEGGAIYISNPFRLINATFINNNATTEGGALRLNNSVGSACINCLFWGNTKGASGSTTNNHISIRTNDTDPESFYLYNSIIQGGIGTLISGTAVSVSATYGGISTYGGTAPFTLYFKNVESTDPQVASLADNGGMVQTISIASTSAAINKGLYVRASLVRTHFLDGIFYSSDNTNWFSDIDLTISATLPANTINFTATDARGYARVGKPDIGAFESGATQ